MVEIILIRHRFNIKHVPYRYCAMLIFDYNNNDNDNKGTRKITHRI